MGQSTFSGPVRVGTVRAKRISDPLAVGPDDNVGYVTLMQTVTISSTSTALSNALIKIPAGSQILDFHYDITVAFNGTSTVATAGIAASGTDYAGAVSLTSVGRVRPTFTAAQLTAMAATAADATTGNASSSINISTTPGAGNNTGTVIVTVIYAQKLNTTNSN
jgi:hypothetical protein